MGALQRISAPCTVPKAQYSPKSRQRQVTPNSNFVTLRCNWFGEPCVCQLARRQSCIPLGARNGIRAGIEEIANNQVLQSAVTAGCLAQLVKPFTSLVAGKGFNWRVVLKSGGMPSSHSASITAAATILGLERGLSDSVFGLAVVLAGIVMYDAQGVRYAAGKHAQLLNTIVLTYFPERVSTSAEPGTFADCAPSTPIGVELDNDPVAQELKFMDNKDVLPQKVPASVSASARDQHLDAQPVKQNGAYARSQSFFEAAKRLPSTQRGEVLMQELETLNGWRLVPLTETLGHSKLQVLFGAIFGVVVTLALHSGLN